jgi:hypothetical protein
MSHPPPPAVDIAWTETRIVADNQQVIVECRPVIVGGLEVGLLQEVTIRYDAEAVMMVDFGGGPMPHQFRFTLHSVLNRAEAFAAIASQVEKAARAEYDKLGRQMKAEMLRQPAPALRR